MAQRKRRIDDYIWLIAQTEIWIFEYESRLRMRSRLLCFKNTKLHIVIDKRICLVKAYLAGDTDQWVDAYVYSYGHLRRSCL